MLSRVLTVFGVLLSLSQAACAHFDRSPASARGLLRGENTQETSLPDLVREVPRGGILVLGENHGLAVHRDQHLAILRALRSAGHQVSVGLEFMNYPDQARVDAWRRGEISEEDFLKAISWGGTPFDFYRPQAEFPNLAEGSRTLALNAPRGLTSKIAKGGIESLSAEEKALLPPDFALGRDSYRRRFESLMPHLPEGPAKERYFAAQSVWDDTMAWRAAEFLKASPGQTLVIVVGDFHVQYGGGLPDRLKARTGAVVKTLSQVDSSGLSPEDLEAEILPSAQDGPRADWIWVDEGRGPETRP